MIAILDFRTPCVDTLPAQSTAYLALALDVMLMRGLLDDDRQVCDAIIDTLRTRHPECDAAVTAYVTDPKCRETVGAVVVATAWDAAYPARED